MYLGDFPASAIVYLPFDTNEADGDSATFTGTTIRIYRDNSTTERTSAAGITLSKDFDALTGAHLLTIDTSDNTDAGFYAAGHDYRAVLVTATIDGKTVTRCVGAWSIENRNIKADVTKWNGTAVATPDTAGHPKVTIKDGTGTGELDLAAGVVLAKDHTGAALALASELLIADGKLNGILNLLTLFGGVADSGSTTTLVDAALTQADADFWKGCWLLFTTGNLAGQVRLITAFDPATDRLTFTPAATQAVSTHAYEILPAAAFDLGMIGNSAQSATDLKDFADDGYDPATNKVQGVVLVDGLSAASYAAVADAVWDEALAAHLAAGSTGAALDAAGGAGSDPLANTAADYSGDQLGAVIGEIFSQSTLIEDRTLQLRQRLAGGKVVKNTVAKTITTYDLDGITVLFVQAYVTNAPVDYDHTVQAST